MTKGVLPTAEQVNEVKTRFLQKLESEPPADAFLPEDLKRITDNDLWVTKLLEAFDLDVEKTLNRLWENLAWRQSYGVYNINESNVNQEYLHDGSIYAHNKDKEGKPLLILSLKKHSKSKSLDDLLRLVVFWIERIHRENDLEKITIFMDMTGSGLGNMDLDFIKSIINMFEANYPYVPNYILVHELPFLLNAAFKLVKTFLPAKALEILRVTSKKDITEYVDKDNCLKLWGGNDDYEYKFE
ncbi:motile sperm domain-containing protein 2 [Drosophila miranda]|uniref:motile sperm domain-containing protein 2 n=1 Tax=Drosophila miranda TaxID=7229 RepID=UPI0007E71CF3|nr:motile sperm domain-containing protein 2 [Drosophila miranda]XP_017137064.1 motile sperm domain-containing protein 2 [Drosophila miranda]